MGIHVNIGEAKTRLSELVAASLRGEEVILAKAGHPVARIVALEDAATMAKEVAKAERIAKWDKAFGYFADKFPPSADDIFLEPSFTEEELDAMYENDLK
jgi:prevent-host-death family protein